MLELDECSVSQLAKLFPNELNSIKSNRILSSRLEIEGIIDVLNV